MSDLAPQGRRIPTFTSGDEVVAALNVPPSQFDTDQVQHMSTGEVMNYEPLTPAEITYAIQEIQAALGRYAVVYPSVVHNRYTTENAFTKARATAMVSAPSGSVADKRAYADLMSMDELEAFTLAKEIQYSADALEKALRSKLFGYLNLNNNLSTLYQSESRAN